MPLREKSHGPETNGALPVASIAAPGDARRAAARNAPISIAFARSAKSCVLPHRRGGAVPLRRRARRRRTSRRPTRRGWCRPPSWCCGAHAWRASECGAPKSRSYSGAGGPRWARWRHMRGQASSRAQRKPAKIWRRMGKSQLRNDVRTAAGWVAHEPPRSTLYSGPKNTSEYSRYGKLVKPGVPVEVGRRPLPHVAEHAGRADVARRAPGRRPPARAPSGAAARRRGQRFASRRRRRRARRAPTPPRWGGGRPTSARTRRPRTSTRAARARRAAPASVRPKRVRTQPPAPSGAHVPRRDQAGLLAPGPARRATTRARRRSRRPRTNSAYARLVTGVVSMR